MKKEQFKYLITIIVTFFVGVGCTMYASKYYFKIMIKAVVHQLELVLYIKRMIKTHTFLLIIMLLKIMKK